MKWQLVLSLLFTLALFSMATKAEEEDYSSNSASDSDESAQDVARDNVQSDYINVADYTPRPHPWWW